MTDDFTFDASAELLVKLGQGILEDDAFRDDHWDGVAVVAQVDGSIMHHAFAYYADGTLRPDRLREFKTCFMFKELADQMATLDGRRWKTCLAQITRPELKLKMTYEYDDINRWMVTPSNLDTMRESLRPE